MLTKYSKITWLGSAKEFSEISEIKDAPHSLKNKEILYYKSCIFGALKINVGDCVLITNSDSFDPENLNKCNLGKILYLYENLELSHNKDPCRAIVQWYSRCDEIPQKYIIQCENIIFDFEREVIEDYRFDSDISIETIFGKFSISYGMESKRADEIIGKRKTTHPTYACRYKLVRKGRAYEILPYDKEYPEHTKTTKSAHKNIYSVVKSHEKTKTPKTKNLVTPIKIMINSESTTKNLIENNNIESPNFNNKSRVVRRRLTLDKNENTQNNDSADDVLNYSIIQDENVDQIKIKLRVSDKQKDNSMSKVNNEVKLQLSPEINNENIQPRRSTRKRSTDQRIDMKSREIDNNSTPKKNRCQSVESGSTPKNSILITARRRSILKTPGTPNYGTPKKNLQLSNIVEEYEIGLKTPRRSVIKKIDDDFCYSEVRKSSGKKRPSPDKLASPKTPKRNKSASKIKLMRDGIETPKLAKKDFSQKGRKSDIQQARESLHVSAAPDRLSCRDVEYDNIYSFLDSKIRDQTGGCMYISGVPGTGKTATVNEVLNQLKDDNSNGDLPEFSCYMLNGLELTDPHQAYVQIYNQMTGKLISWKQAYNFLQNKFLTPSPKRIPTILVIDELDIICNRRQDVIYNLLDWTTKSASKLAVITIANTMDLPERFLKGKVTSRLGLTRLTFLPYTFKQLQQIVSERLVDSDVFKSEAVQLVARKIAAVSGDARRALDISRRAVEIAEENSQKDTKVMVNLNHVQQALGEMIASGKIQAIKNCSKLEKIFLQSVSAEVTRTGVEETNFLSVYIQFESLTAFSGIQTPSPDHTLKICSKLGAMRLIISDATRNDLYTKMLLNVSSDDIHFALQDDLF